jgi:hypothetical protein
MVLKLTEKPMPVSFDAYKGMQRIPEFAFEQWRPS